MASPELPPDVGDRNVERLLSEAYAPETLDAAFMHGVQERLLSAAAQLARERTPAADPRPAALGGASQARLRWGRVYAVAVALAGIALLFHALGGRPGKHASPPSSASGPPDLRRLAPRPRPATRAARPAAVGEVIRTGPTERQRWALPDGSTLYVNADTSLRVAGRRCLTLRRGEVFVEVAPRPLDAAFMVQAGKRDVSALGTRFAVRTGARGTGVVVAQGKVKVSDVDGVVRAGQEVPPDGLPRPRPAARVSHLLDWTRELMVAAEVPLVPPSKHAGGDLVAASPHGGEARLDLRRLHIDAYIEDGFARTTVDQTYFNPNPWRTEGTFYFPLPPDASLSRLAMYVDGQLREGGMAERDLARRAFETIVARQKDPALLEWVDGSTFKMRVFPLEGRQEKRIILSYTQKLPALHGRSRYRFPSGHSLNRVERWSFHARVKGGAAWQATCSSHLVDARTEGGDLFLDARAGHVRPDRDVALELYNPGQDAAGKARFATAVQRDTDGKPEARYLTLRYRPQLHSLPRRERRDWLFLVESSADRNSLLARTQIELVRGLLENAEADDTFNILTATTRPRAFADAPRPANPENVRAAVAFLEQAHRLGALDLGRALGAAAGRLKSARNPYLVHLGSGLPALGERRPPALSRLLPRRVRYVGVAVGKRWGRAFMRSAAARTGGYVAQVNPDEPVGWRAFDLMATLNTPRLLDVQVTDDAGRVTFLTDDFALAQGEELSAVARLRADGRDLPRSVTVRGTLDSKPMVETIAVTVKDAAPDAGYLPRTWARREIDRLLTAGGARHRDEIVRLSKQMYVMSPYTSLLVLENDAMHQQFKIDFGRKDHWAPYDCPRQIKVVTEPIEEENARPLAAPPPPAVERVLQTILVRVLPRFLVWEDEEDGPHAGQRYVTAFDLRGGGAGVPTAEQPPRVLQEELDEEARDAEIEINPAFERLAEVTVPGEVVVGETVGVVGTKDGPEVSLSLPGGSGDSPNIGTGGGYAGGGRPAPGSFYGRSGATKKAALLEGGGGPESETVVSDGLNWIVRHQFRDGHWSLDGFHLARRCTCRNRGNHPNDIAATAFGLLPLLGAGHTHKTRKGIEGSYQKNVLAALNYLMRRQNKRTGDFGGGMYAHGLATIALCEAFGMTQDRLLKRSAQAAVNFIVKAQDPTGGGWRYVPRQAGDTSVTGWQVMALKSAQMAQLEVPARTMKRAQQYLDSRMNGTDYGYGYTSKRSTPTMSAVGLLCRQYIQGWGPASPRMARGVHNHLMKNLPGSSTNFYYFYHASQVLHHVGGNAWREWNSRMKHVLIKGQDRGADLRHPDQRGSWSPVGDPHADTGGRLLATALAVLTLEVYYRHLPLYRRVNEDNPDVKEDSSPAEDTGDVRVPFPEGSQGLAGVFHGSSTSLNRRLGHGLTSRFVPAAPDYEVDDLSVWLRNKHALGSLLYRPLRFSDDERWFTDLAVYAPGLNTTRADVQAVLEAETSTGKDPRTGTIDPAARALIDSARRAGWQEVRITAETPFRVVFDGRGRYAYERLVFGGLRERVICDGKHLWHLYPELALGARRVVSRFHRAEFAALTARAQHLTLRKAAAPDLRPDLKHLVVVPMPLRSRAHILRTAAPRWQGQYADLPAEAAVALVAAESLTGNGWNAHQIFAERFHAQGDRRLGFLTLLAGAGYFGDPRQDASGDQTGKPINVAADHPKEPLARFLAFASLSQSHNKPLDGAAIGGPADGFLRRLAEFRSLWTRWVYSPASPADQAALQRDLALVRRWQSPAFQAAILAGMREHAGVESQRSLAAAYRLLKDSPGFAYAARYEEACCLVAANEDDRASRLFRALYADTVKAGVCPRVDEVFYRLLCRTGNGKDWRRLTHDASAALIAAQRRPAVISLAWQCRTFNENELADWLYARACADVPEKERKALSLVGFQYCWHSGNHRGALALLQALLADNTIARHALPWRLAAFLADRQEQTAYSVACRDRALEIEYRKLPEGTNLRTVREEYGTLFRCYQRLAVLSALPGEGPSRDLLARVVRAAERWRSLDPSGTEVCQAAARVLQRLGAPDLAWEYYTTPAALRPDDPAPWLEAARALIQDEDFDRADQAYAAAFEADPTNPQVLFDRAGLLQQVGKTAQGRRLWRQIVDGKWQPQHEWLQDAARQSLREE